MRDDESWTAFCYRYSSEDGFDNEYYDNYLDIGSKRNENSRKIFSSANNRMLLNIDSLN